VKLHYILKTLSITYDYNADQSTAPVYHLLLQFEGGALFDLNVLGKIITFKNYCSSGSGAV
jgi:hypothetical protein